MVSLDSIRAAHRALSEADWRFRQLALDTPALQHRESFRAFDRSADLLMFPVQSWPTFVSRERSAELARAAVAISDLIRAIPRRIFRHDVEMIDRFYGVGNPSLTELLLAAPNGIGTALSRGDFVYGPAGFQCIEFNVSSALGGWEVGILARMQLANPAIAAALERLGVEVSYTDPMRSLLPYLTAVIEDLGLDDGGEINLAFTVDIVPETQRRAEALGRYLQDELDLLLAGSSRRGRALVCRSSDFSADGNCILRFAGHRLQAVVEIERVNPDPLSFRVFKAGGVALFNGPVVTLLSDKRNLALLSDESLDSDLSAEERAFLRRYLPWTRIVQPEWTTFHDVEGFLPDLVEAERERLVLKNARLYGGRQVLIGRATPAAEWAAALRGALEGSWVVQEFIPSQPFLYQAGDVGVVPHDVIWGPFVFGRRYGGAVLRMQPAGTDAAVNLSQTAAEGILFEVDSGDAQREAGELCPPA